MCDKKQSVFVIFSKLPFTLIPSVNVREEGEDERGGRVSNPTLQNRFTFLFVPDGGLCIKSLSPRNDILVYPVFNLPKIFLRLFPSPLSSPTGGEETGKTNGAVGLVTRPYKI